MLYNKHWDVAVPEFEQVSRNQHGGRYRYVKTKYHRTGRMYANKDCAGDMKQLILIAQMLRIPVEYDFDEQRAYIRIAAVTPKGGG